MAQAWQVFDDAVPERRLTHSADPVLARHVANLTLRSDRSGVRPDLDVAEGQPIAAALAAMIALERVVALGAEPDPSP